MHSKVSNHLALPALPTPAGCTVGIQLKWAVSRPTHRTFKDALRLWKTSCLNPQEWNIYSKICWTRYSFNLSLERLHDGECPSLNFWRFFTSHKYTLRETLPDPAGLNAHSSPAFPSVRHAFNDGEDLVEICYLLVQRSLRRFLSLPFLLSSIKYQSMGGTRSTG